MYFCGQSDSYIFKSGWLSCRNHADNFSTNLTQKLKLEPKLLHNSSSNRSMWPSIVKIFSFHGFFWSRKRENHLKHKMRFISIVLFKNNSLIRKKSSFISKSNRKKYVKLRNGTDQFVGVDFIFAELFNSIFGRWKFRTNYCA